MTITDTGRGMRERIARAVYEHRKQVQGYGNRERILTFGEATPSRREECYAIADATLAEFAEPTEAMIEAAKSALDDWFVSSAMPIYPIEAIWKAMITAAGEHR